MAATDHHICHKYLVPVPWLSACCTMCALGEAGHSGGTDCLVLIWCGVDGAVAMEVVLVFAFATGRTLVMPPRQVGRSYKPHTVTSYLSATRPLSSADK